MRKDGSILWASLSTSPIQDADGGYAGALAMVRDITEHHEAETRLRAAEERFRSLFENAPHVLWEDDLSGVKAYIDGLRASGVTDLREHFARHPEDVVVCFSKAKILDVNQAGVRLYEARDKAELITGLERILAPESNVVLAEELIALAEGRPSSRAKRPTRRSRVARTTSCSRPSSPPGVRRPGRACTFRSSTSRRARCWKSNCARRKRWRRSAASPAASRTTSTTC